MRVDARVRCIFQTWSRPVRTLETVALVGNVGGVVFAFGDEPGDSFQVHSLCTLRNDFINLLAARGTPPDAPVAPAAAE